MAFVAINVSFSILILYVLGATAEKRSVLDLPDLSILTTSDQGITKYKISGCELSVSQDGCKISFAPIAASCKTGLSLNQIVKRFFPSLDIKKISDGMVIPGIFKIEKFKLNKCEGEIDFTAIASEPIDVIPGKIKVSQGKLTLAFNFKAAEFDISSFGIKISGVLTVGAQTLKLSAKKLKKSDEFSFFAEGDQVSLASFAKLFTKKDLSEVSSSKKIESLTNAAIDKPKITGLRDKDGLFEFVLQGKVRDLSVMDKAELFLIVQKPSDGKVAVALICNFEGLSPTEIITLVVGKDLSKLPLVKDVAMNFVLEIASDTIETVRDDEANKALIKYISAGRTVCKGAKIKVEMPIHEIMRSVNKHMVDKVPEKLYVTIFISASGVEFQFPDNFTSNLLNILIALTPAIPKMLPKGIFKNGPPKVDIKRFNVDVKTGTIDLSVVAPDPIVIGNDLATICNAAFDLKHDKTPDSPWEFKISAEQKIGDASLKVFVEKKGKKDFVFSATVKSMTTKGLIKRFGAKLFPTKSLEEMHFFNFGIRDLKVEGRIGDKISLRISGNPVLFDWEGAKLEGFIFGDKTKSMALGISLAKIRLDEIVMKLFKKKLKNTWLTEVDVGLTISNVDAGKDKEVSFTIPELKKKEISKGAIFSTVFTLPSDCKGDALCNQAKSMLDKDTKFYLEGKVESTGMELKAAYKGNMLIQGSLELNDVKFVLSVGKETSIYFEVVLSMKEPKITFKGKLSIGLTGQVELKLTMENIWKKPFGLEYLAFGNMILAVGIQPGVPLPILEIGGEVHFGKIDSGKEIKAQAYLGISPNNPIKNYFYTNINKLSAGAIARAFDYDLELPKVLSESGFPEGVIASFTTNPSGKTIDHIGIKINPGFSLKGLINILGFKLRCTILINFRKEIMLDVSFSPIKIAKGLIALQRTKKDEENGPKLHARLSMNSVEVKLQAYASLLGISSYVNIDITNDYMKFHIYGNLFNLIAANLTVQAGYDKLEEADFLVSTCISTPIGNIQDNVGNGLEDIAGKTTKAVKNAEKKVENATSLFDSAREKLVKWEDKVKQHENEIRESCQKVQEIKDELDDPCLEKCGEVCIGGAYWKKKCNKVLGKWLGCTKWNKCKHKVPDTICIAKCKGKKVVKKVKGVAKQAGIEVLLGILNHLKKALKFAHGFVEKSRTLVALAEKGLNAVRGVLDVGISIGKAIGNYTVNGLVNIHHLCFNSSLEKASTSCIGINVNATFFGQKNVAFVANTCMDVSFVNSIAKVIKNKLFPGVQSIKKGLEKAKSLFFDMDSKKEELENDIKLEEEEEGAAESGDDDDDSDRRSGIAFNEEEKYFQRVAFGDLPRVTLRDDDTVRAFEEHSPWKMIQTDQLFEEDLSDDDFDVGESGSGEKEHFVLEARDFSSALREPNGCRAVRNALADLRPLVTALHAFHQNLHMQRKSYIEEKKSRLEELQSVTEELQSECSDEEMSKEDQWKAMYYINKVHNGTLQWLDLLKSQIKEQERRGLMLWKKDIELVMRHKRGTGVGALLDEINHKQPKISKKDKIETELQMKLRHISELTQKLLFDDHLSFEKDKPLLMESLRNEFDEAQALLASCG